LKGEGKHKPYIYDGNLEPKMVFETIAKEIIFYNRAKFEMDDRITFFDNIYKFVDSLNAAEYSQHECNWVREDFGAIQLKVWITDKMLSK
jgi:hypothetical protein